MDTDAGSIEIKYGDNNYISKTIKIDAYSYNEEYYTYNSNNQIIKIESFEKVGDEPMPSSPDITTFQYNDKGLIISQKDVYYDDDEIRSEFITTYKYNKEGLVIKSIGNQKDIEIFEYNSNGNLIKNYPEGRIDELNRTFKYENKTIHLKDFILKNS